MVAQPTDVAATLNSQLRMLLSASSSRASDVGRHEGSQLPSHPLSLGG